MNNKGQLDAPIITFVIVVITLFLLAPVILKVVSTSVGGVATAINSTSPSASTSANHIKDTFINFWDMLIMFAVLSAIIVMLIAAFFVDISPLFAILHILISFFLVIFSNDILQAVTRLWTASGYNELTDAHLVMTGYLVDNFTFFLLGVIILSGVIMYGKFRFAGGDRI